MLLDKIRHHIENLNKYIKRINDIINSGDFKNADELTIYKQNALDIMVGLNDLSKEQNFNSLYNVHQLFLKSIDYDNRTCVKWFDKEYFIDLTKSVKGLTQDDYEKFVDLISYICINTLNTEANYEFVKIIKNNLDKDEIDNVCKACSNRVKSMNETISNVFSVRLKDEEPVLEIGEDELLTFQKNVIKLLEQIGEGCVYFGASKLKNIFKDADIEKLKMLYTYFEKYRINCLEYYTNVKVNKNLQEYYSNNIIQFPEIIIPGSDLRCVLTQDFNSVLGRMFTQRELCSDKFSSKEIDLYKQSIAFMKNFIIYLRKDFYYSYTNRNANGGQPDKMETVKTLKEQIMKLPSTLNAIQTELVMPDTHVENLLKQIKRLKSYFKKDGAEYCIYKGDYSDMFVKETKEVYSPRFNSTQKEIMLYYLPFGRIEVAVQIARLDISKENQMIHKPKGGQGAKIISKYHLHIYSENDQLFSNVDLTGKSKKPAGYEISSIISEILDEGVAIKYFNEEFSVPDPDKGLFLSNPDKDLFLSN